MLGPHEVCAYALNAGAGSVNPNLGCASAEVGPLTAFDDLRPLVARVRVRAGSGAIVVNGRPVEQYFPSATHRTVLTEPLRLTSTEEVYDIDASVLPAGQVVFEDER